MAYVLDRNPCGSSSGSGVSTSVDLAVAAVGTETDGSVVCPSGANGDAGVKPTLGLLSRAGIVPISADQDTAGPMARNVTDAAVLLGAMTGVDAQRPGHRGAGRATPSTDYTQFLDPHALEGARIGVWREFAYEINGEPVDPDVSAIMDDTIAALEAQGATIVDPADIVFGDWANAEFPALLCEFKTDIATYLETYTGPGYPKTLQDLIDFNNAHPELESGAPISDWNNAVFDLAQATNGRDQDCADQRAIATPGAQAAIDDLMAADDLDAIISATNGPPGSRTRSTATSAATSRRSSARPGRPPSPATRRSRCRPASSARCRSGSRSWAAAGRSHSSSPTPTTSSRRPTPGSRRSSSRRSAPGTRRRRRRARPHASTGIPSRPGTGRWAGDPCADASIGPPDGAIRGSGEEGLDLDARQRPVEVLADPALVVRALLVGR